MNRAEQIRRLCQQLDRQLEDALRKAGFETDLTKLLPAIRKKLPSHRITKARQGAAPTRPDRRRIAAAHAGQRKLSDVPPHLHRHLRRV